MEGKCHHLIVMEGPGSNVIEVSRSAATEVRILVPRDRHPLPLPYAFRHS